MRPSSAGGPHTGTGRAGSSRRCTARTARIRPRGGQRFTACSPNETESSGNRFLRPIISKQNELSVTEWQQQQRGAAMPGQAAGQAWQQPQPYAQPYAQPQYGQPQYQQVQTYEPHQPA